MPVKKVMKATIADLPPMTASAAGTEADLGEQSDDLVLVADDHPPDPGERADVEGDLVAEVLQTLHAARSN